MLSRILQNLDDVSFVQVGSLFPLARASKSTSCPRTRLEVYPGRVNEHLPPAPAVPLSASKLNLSETIQKGNCYPGVCAFTRLWIQTLFCSFIFLSLRSNSGFQLLPQCRASFMERSEMSSIIPSSLLLVAT